MLISLERAFLCFESDAFLDSNVLPLKHSDTKLNTVVFKSVCRHIWNCLLINSLQALKKYSTGQERASSLEGIQLWLNPTVGTICGTQMAEHVIWESSPMVRYRTVLICVQIQSLQLSTGTRLACEAIEKYMASKNERELM